MSGESIRANCDHDDLIPLNSKGGHTDMEFEVGDLVVWSPTGKKGLWCVIPHQKRHVPDLTRKIHLKWVGGWAGYSGKGYPVYVRRKEIYLANEMEALAIMAIEDS